ncbi:UNVERIFIED_CONTAM: hypothetical protein K2H54_035560 [Gekko kuhli]
MSEIDWAGMIRTDKDEFFIEPLQRGKQEEEEEGRMHMVYRRAAAAKKLLPSDHPDLLHRGNSPEVVILTHLGCEDEDNQE